MPPQHFSESAKLREPVNEAKYMYVAYLSIFLWASVSVQNNKISVINYLINNNNIIIIINCRGDGADFDLDIIGNLSSAANEPDHVMRSELLGESESLSFSFSVNASLSLPLGGIVPDKWLYNFSLDFHVYFNDTHAPDLTCPVSTM